MQAGAATLQLQRESLVTWQKPSWCSAAARPNGSKSRDPGWEGSSGPRIGLGKKPGTSDRKIGKGRRGRRGGRRAVFMVVEKSSEATVYATSLIRRPLNPGGQTPRLRLPLVIQ